MPTYTDPNCDCCQSSSSTCCLGTDACGNCEEGYCPPASYYVEFNDLVLCIDCVFAGGIALEVDGTETAFNLAVCFELNTACSWTMTPIDGPTVITYLSSDCTNPRAPEVGEITGELLKKANGKFKLVLSLGGVFFASTMFCADDIDQPCNVPFSVANSVSCGGETCAQGVSTPTTASAGTADVTPCCPEPPP